MASKKQQKKVENVPVAKSKTEPKRPAVFSPQMIGAIADEVSKTLMTRLPNMIIHPGRRRSKKAKSPKKIENGIFLDTSAIIDNRIFDVIYLGLLTGTIVITSSILLELKHLADSQDTVKRERGRKGLESLEKLRKSRKMKVEILPDMDETKKVEVDELLIKSAKIHKGKIITCDYNLEKKAAVEGVSVINVNALSNTLKVIAVPGEALHVKLSHVGKEATQGVGYLDDGTMIVVEEGKEFVGKSLDVVVARVIQTVTGRILFAKKI